MKSHSIRAARQHLGQLVEAAQRGETVVITRRGKGVASLGPIAGESLRLPDLSEFRASIKVNNASLSSTVLAERDSARF